MESFVEKKCEKLAWFPATIPPNRNAAARLVAGKRQYVFQVKMCNCQWIVSCCRNRRSSIFHRNERHWGVPQTEWRSCGGADGSGSVRKGAKHHRNCSKDDGLRCNSGNSRSILSKRRAPKAPSVRILSAKCDFSRRKDSKNEWFIVIDVFDCRG